MRPENAVVEEVKLSFTPKQGKYIKSLPLHATQKIIIDNDDEFVITLSIFITYDFIQEILQYGDEVKVIKPDSLVKTIKQIHENALRRY